VTFGLFKCVLGCVFLALTTGFTTLLLSCRDPQNPEGETASPEMDAKAPSAIQSAFEQRIRSFRLTFDRHRTSTQILMSGSSEQEKLKSLEPAPSITHLVARAQI
jgi:hypothetical protein